MHLLLERRMMNDVDQWLDASASSRSASVYSYLGSSKQARASHACFIQSCWLATWCREDMVAGLVKLPLVHALHMLKLYEGSSHVDVSKEYVPPVHAPSGSRFIHKAGTHGGRRDIWHAALGAPKPWPSKRGHPMQVPRT